MLSPTSSRPGPGRWRRRRWRSGAVTLLAALATVLGVLGLQAPAASAGVARGQAAQAMPAAVHAAPASKSQAPKTAASKRSLQSFASTVRKGGKAGHKVTV